MVDIAGGVPADLAINIIAIVERKNIDVALRSSPGTFVFRNLLSDISENPSPWLDLLRGKETETSNRGCTHPDTHLHRIVPHHAHYACLRSARVL